ncbi:unnamed protein product [Paramecium octaurelia]|uniref:Tubulin/FtsZ GTPase domain-containing protein n=1 Tax=Paramecium octaurelia TaxID=43137 RepID=A0A8S1SX25_PAROT|nr:unnamed protein product [Paramecium octaurelia]
MSSALHIHIGGAGVMIGDMLWKLYEKEYNEATQNNYIYEEVDGNHYPLAVFIDSDDRMIHEVQRDKTVKFRKHSFLHGKEDASNYARGWNVGRELRDQGLDQTMDRLDEFVVTYSIIGGAGSGFGYEIMHNLSIDFGEKVNKKGFIIFPSSEMSNNVVGLYNAVLSIDTMTRYFDCITVFDNQSMYNAIDHQLDLDFVDYQHLNNLVAQIISSYTGLRRFSSYDNSKFISHLCPYPMVHFLIPSYGQMTLINNYTRRELEQGQFIKYVTKKDQKLYQCPQNPYHLSTTLLFRQKELDCFYGKQDLTLKNLDHCFGQRTNIIQCKSSNYQVLPELASMKQTGTFFSNDASIVSRLNLLNHQFHKVYSKRAFVHWYVGDGLEEKIFCESFTELDKLIYSYEDLLILVNEPNEIYSNDEL